MNRAAGGVGAGGAEPAARHNLHLGFEPQHASSVGFNLTLQGYDETRAREFQRRALARVRALPGIQSAGMISGLPLSLNWNNSTIFIEGKPASRVADATMAAMFRITPGYFRAAGTRMIAGRDFAESDSAQARRVAVVNESLRPATAARRESLGKAVPV